MASMVRLMTVTMDMVMGDVHVGGDGDGDIVPAGDGVKVTIVD